MHACNHANYCMMHAGVASSSQTHVAGGSNYCIMHAGAASSKVVVGDAKLELEYNDLNPQYPVVLVKLLDILFQSSKQLPSGEVVYLKCGIGCTLDFIIVFCMGGSTKRCCAVLISHIAR